MNDEIDMVTYAGAHEAVPNGNCAARSRTNAEYGMLGGRRLHHPKLDRYLRMMRLPSVVVMQYPAVVRFLVVRRTHRGA